MDLPLSSRRTSSYSPLSRLYSDTFSGGSSYGGSSGDHFLPSDSDHGGSRPRGEGNNKSLAQLTESYQLQLALALRLTRDAKCADDPNFLDLKADGLGLGSGASVKDMILRFWMDGCLSYFDKVPDGFYTIYGMDPYVWSMCTDIEKDDRIPSIDSLRSTSPVPDFLIAITFVDMHNDFTLKELERKIQGISRNCNTKEDVVDQLAKIVSSQMGGASPAGEEDLVPLWKDFCYNLQQRVGSVVVPIGCLSVGLCQHRALLFKVLADSISLQCRIAKGCKYCSKDDAASCLVLFDHQRECVVDLIGNPGRLCKPDSLINGPNSIMTFSPLGFPRCEQVEPTIDYKSMAKQFFEDFKALDIKFKDPPTDSKDSIHTKQSENPHVDGLDDSNEFYDTLENVFGSGGDTSEDSSFVKITKPSHEIALDIEDLDTLRTDIVMKETIGEGSFVVVDRGDQQGSDVALKKLMDQDFHPQWLMEFYKEVSIMKRLRWPILL